MLYSPISHTKCWSKIQNDPNLDVSRISLMTTHCLLNQNTRIKTRLTLVSSIHSQIDSTGDFQPLDLRFPMTSYTFYIKYRILCRVGILHERYVNGVIIPSPVLHQKPRLTRRRCKLEVQRFCAGNMVIRLKDSELSNRVPFQNIKYYLSYLQLNL